MSERECKLCKELETQIQGNQQATDTLKTNLISLKEKIINSSKVLSVFNQIQEENEILKEENERLRQEFTEYKSARSVPLQVAQYQQMKSYADQLAYLRNTAKYTEEQLKASTENALKAKEENELLKNILESKENDIRELKRLVVSKNDAVQEYMERGSDKIKLLEAEVKILEKRREEGVYRKTETIESTLDEFIDGKINELINQAVPDIVKSIGQHYNLKPIPKDNNPLYPEVDDSEEENGIMNDLIV